jgi:hypothetical protein
MIRESYSKTGDVLVDVLHRDISAVPIAIIGVSWKQIDELVMVDYEDTTTPADRAAGAAIVAAHVPVDPLVVIQENAYTNANNIPGWAHWTEPEAETWWDTNIDTPLDDARTDIDGLSTLNLTVFKAVMNGLLDILEPMSTMMWAMARMLIALRDKQWPNLSN